MLPLALTLAWFVSGYILAQWTLLLNCRNERLEYDSVCVMALLFFAVALSFFGPFWLVGLIVEKAGCAHDLRHHHVRPRLQAGAVRRHLPRRDGMAAGFPEEGFAMNHPAQPAPEGALPPILPIDRQLAHDLVRPFIDMQGMNAMNAMNAAEVACQRIANWRAALADNAALRAQLTAAQTALREAEAARGEAERRIKRGFQLVHNLVEDPKHDGTYRLHLNHEGYCELANLLDLSRAHSAVVTDAQMDAAIADAARAREAKS